MLHWNELAQRVLNGHSITKEESLTILNSDEDDILSLMDAAFIIRKHYFAKKVKLNMIISTKTGYCPENCGYCAQSIDSTAPIEKNTMMSKEEIIAGAKRAYELNSGTYCIVASGRGPTNRELEDRKSVVQGKTVEDSTQGQRHQ